MKMTCSFKRKWKFKNESERSESKVWAWSKLNSASESTLWYWILNLQCKSTTEMTLDFVFSCILFADKKYYLMQKSINLIGSWDKSRFWSRTTECCLKGGRVSESTFWSCLNCLKDVELALLMTQYVKWNWKEKTNWKWLQLHDNLMFKKSFHKIYMYFNSIKVRIH